ncbi:MAG: hypothetical protein WAK48_10205 [Candidatus Acidiferrum sp.]|jgi:hypothetical protein
MPEAEVAAENILATARKTEAPPAIVKTAAPAVVRELKRQSFLVYWREVGRSFARDGQQFLEHYAMWLGSLSEKRACMEIARLWLLFLHG